MFDEFFGGIHFGMTIKLVNAYLAVMGITCVYKRYIHRT